MNPMETELETELIQIPKSHFQSMNARLRGIKNIIRLYVAKENELKLLKRKYQTMEAKHTEQVERLISEKIKGLSVYNGAQTATFHSLPLQSPEAKEVGVSEETYYDVLKQLCHARSVLSILRRTTDKPLLIETWTQTNEKWPPGAPTDTDTELTQNYQALQKRLEKQQSELESLKEKNADLSEELEKEKSTKKSTVENEKKSSAKLKRELERHEKTKQELQKLKQEHKVKEFPKSRISLTTTCSSQVCTDFHGGNMMNALEVDCGREHIPKQCMGCYNHFSTDEELEYHYGICKKLRKKSNN